MIETDCTIQRRKTAVGVLNSAPLLAPTEEPQVNNTNF